MSASANPTSADYDLRSLNHERRMLAVYRRQSSHDPAALQPLANACWRAASFEWALYRDPETVRRLWGEAADTLARGDGQVEREDELAGARVEAGLTAREAARACARCLAPQPPHGLRVAAERPLETGRAPAGVRQRLERPRVRSRLPPVHGQHPPLVVQRAQVVIARRRVNGG